jgi:hypothetical protein
MLIHIFIYWKYIGLKSSPQKVLLMGQFCSPSRQTAKEVKRKRQMKKKKEEANTGQGMSLGRPRALVWSSGGPGGLVGPTALPGPAADHGPAPGRSSEAVDWAARARGCTAWAQGGQRARMPSLDHHEELRSDRSFTILKKKKKKIDPSLGRMLGILTMFSFAWLARSLLDRL